MDQTSSEEQRLNWQKQIFLDIFQCDFYVCVCVIFACLFF